MKKAETKVGVGYEALVAQAEKAVSSVKDPELRRAAFEKILDRLLTGTGSLPHERPAREGLKKARTKGGPRAYIEELVTEGYFSEQRTLPKVKAELANRGHHVPQTSLSSPLQKLCQEHVLRRERLKIDGGKTIFAYSKW